MTAPFTAQPDSKRPAVTIVIAFRERWRFTPLTVASILEHSEGPFELWLLDPGMPDAIRDALRQHVQSGDLTLVPVAPGRPPNHWRAEIASRLTSPYAVFIDNDVVVTPGWLDAMVECAEATGAGIVCPLYLWGDREESDLIHMAGGCLVLEPGEEGIRMTESHRHVGRRIADWPEELQRETCGFGEYHCLMMRRDIYSNAEMFDARIATVHEHIHASMLARELGLETYFEPQSRVNYLAFAPWLVGDLRDFRSRWDYSTGDDSLGNFAKRWNVIDDDDYRRPVRRFLVDHSARSDVVDCRPGMDARRNELISRGDLEQTFGGLQWLASVRGYDVEEIKLIRRAYRVAMALTEGVYRPCGRPFLNHLAGTASVLLFYGCPLPLILASLLHAAHTHGPPGATDKWLKNFAQTGPAAKAATRLAELYADRHELLELTDLGPDELAELPVETARLFVLDAANEVDMHHSLEVAVCGRGDVLAGTRLDNCKKVLKAVGLPGLAKTLDSLGEGFGDAEAVPFQAGMTISFRVSQARSAGDRPSQQPRAATGMRVDNAVETGAS